MDWIFLALIALSAFRCLKRGFVEELLSMAAPVVGIGAAILLYGWGAELLISRFGVTTLPQVLAFAAIFLIAFVLVKLLGRMIREGLEAANLDKADKALGFVLGLAEGLIAVALVLLVLEAQPVFDLGKLLEGSAFAKTILPAIGPSVAGALAPIKKLPSTGK